MIARQIGAQRIQLFNTTTSTQGIGADLDVYQVIANMAPKPIFNEAIAQKLLLF